VGGRAALDQRAGVADDVVGDLEGLLGVEAEHLLGGGDLVGAERRAVDPPVFILVGAGQPMTVRSAMNDGLSVTGLGLAAS
jgi:hypothetical protein